VNRLSFLFLHVFKEKKNFVAARSVGILPDEMTHFAQAARLLLRKKISAGILEQSMGARNRIGNFTRNRVVVSARKATLAESIPGLRKSFLKMSQKRNSHIFYSILFFRVSDIFKSTFERKLSQMCFVIL
jgi:hypothetical protein